MVDGTRAKCRACGEHFVPSKIQSEGHSNGPWKCRTCYIQECEHEQTTKTRQSGKRFCTDCGKVVESGKRLKTLEAW